MSQEVKTVTLVPKAGRGLVTSVSRHNLGDLSDSFNAYFNVVVANGNWRVRLAEVHDNFSGAGKIWGSHFFNSIDTSSSSATAKTCILAVVGPNAGVTVLDYLDLTGVPTFATILASVAAPYELSFLTIKNRCFIAGQNNPPTIFQRYPSAATYSWGKAGGTSDLSYDPYTDATNAATKVFFKAADINNAGGSIKTWTSTTSAFDNSGAWDGKTIVIEGVSYTIDTVVTTATLKTTTNGPVGALVNKDFKVFYGNLSWTVTPPKYAYAYYNPDTGHITNLSPVLTLTEQDISNANVNLQGIPGTNDPVYTRIVIFRTGSDGGDLFPLKLDPGHGGTATVNASDFMIENTYVGVKTYRDGQPDVKLGQILGAIVGPTLNNPPPTGIRFTAYWDGRVWFVDPARPWELGYSGSPTQNPLGVPEECFPARNRIPIGGDDGHITCTRVTGGTLLVGSAKFLYYVAGSNENDYRLVRISSRAVNVGHWAIDEHPGDTTADTASVIYVGQDRRVWQQFPGGRMVDIGKPIQEKLDAVPLDVSRPFFVRVGQIERNWICALGFINAAKTKYSFFFYDFDNSQWYDWAHDEGRQPGWSISYGTLYPDGVGVMMWGGNDLADFAFFGERAPLNATNVPSVLKTQHMDMNEPTSKKILEDVIVFVDDDTAAFGARIGFDGADSAAGPVLTLVPVTGTPRYPGPGVLHMVPKTAQGVAGRQWHTLQVRVSIPADGTPTKHYVSKIEIIYKLASTGIQGRPS